MGIVVSHNFLFNYCKLNFHSKTVIKEICLSTTNKCATILLNNYFKNYLMCHSFIWNSQWKLFAN